ncbi:hypothetical protein NSU_2186 [Novosphingobium pentaromativorans US6-1]|uniref:Uncharacterized protein n=1 Tax=Novosphingobium pentaromativorans US6-1 TaxID=1088721 RepID=G6ECW5_9SPHN|nr:hypothetical protein NSU_2186 [Novosphingobium pentaromativorans US6-1]
MHGGPIHAFARLLKGRRAGSWARGRTAVSRESAMRRRRSGKGLAARALTFRPEHGKFFEARRHASAVRPASARRTIASDYPHKRRTRPARSSARKDDLNTHDRRSQAASLPHISSNRGE